MRGHNMPPGWQIACIHTLKTERSGGESKETPTKLFLRQAREANVTVDICLCLCKNRFACPPQDAGEAERKLLALPSSANRRLGREEKTEKGAVA